MTEMDPVNQDPLICEERAFQMYLDDGRACNNFANARVQGISLGSNRAIARMRTHACTHQRTDPNGCTHV